MGKIRSFLRFFVLFIGVVFATNSFADGYTCDDIKMYTSCNPGYYMSLDGEPNTTPTVGNACTLCEHNYYCPGGSVTTNANARLDCDTGTTTTNTNNYWVTKSMGSTARTQCYRQVILSKNGGNGTVRVTSPVTGTIESAAGTTVVTTQCYYGIECALPMITDQTSSSHGIPNGLYSAYYKYCGGWSTSSATLASCTSTTPTSVTVTSTASSVTYYAQKTGDDFTISLDNNGATTAGTTAIYTRYDVNVYLDAAHTKVMTTTTNPISLPAKSYTVTYDANGGTVATTSQTATYTFNGYYSAATGGTQYIAADGKITDTGTTQIKAASTDLMLYARWTGVPVTTPTPTRAGYTFNGWAESSTATSGETGTYIPTASKTLYATWTPTPYTIEYNLNGGTNYTNAPANYTIETATITLGTPTRANSTFVGWYTSSSFTTTATQIAKGSTGNKAFYAKWECNEGYTPNDDNTACNVNTITLSWANGDHGNAPTTPESCTYGEKFEMPPAMTADGYTFGNWSVNNKTFSTGASVTCNKDNLGVTSGGVTITGTWTANTFNISYAGNGNTGGSAPTSPTSCQYGNTCTAPSNEYTKTNYVFTGWKCTGGTTTCDGDIIAAGASLMNVSTGSAITLTAQWSECACTKGSNVSACSVTGVSNNACTYSYTCADGYNQSSSTFTGTAAKGTNTSPNCSAGGYDVTYDCGDGDGTAPSNGNATYGSNFELATNTCTRTGYTFAGWAVSGTSDVKTSDFTWNYTESKELTAQWDANCNKITLANKTNGGTSGTTELYKLTDSTAWYTNSSCTDTAVTALPTKPTKSNATYAGHYTGSAATGGTQYIDKDGKLSSSWTVTDAQTLTAQYSCDANWRGAGTKIKGACTGTTYTITLNDNNGTGGSGTAKQVYSTKWTNDAGTTITSVNVPKRSGYVFNGYYTAASNGTQRITNAGVLPSNTTFTANTELYAQWTQCTACSAGAGATCSMSVENNKCTYTTKCATGYKDITNSGAYNPSCTPIIYSIVYNANDGSGSTASNTGVKYTDSVTLSTNGFTNGVKQFLGWSTSSGATTATYTNKQTVSTPFTSTDGATVTLYAVWGSDCTCSKGTGVASCTATASLGICGTATATNATGYNKAQCKPSSNGVSECSAIANKYTVVFNPNGGDGTMSDQSFTYNVAQNLRANTFTKDGLNFQGWALSSNGDVEYSDKASAKNLTTTNNGRVELFAVWGDAISYTITYIIDDGATHNNATTYTVESPVTFTDATKAGYTFGGWFNDAAYNNRITKTSGTGNITVYGKLTPNEYTITYDCNGGDIQMPYTNTKSVTFDGEFTNQPGTMCARTGYTFTGWNGKYPKANTEYTYTTVGNTTLTAQWTANKYTCDKGEYLPMLKTQCDSCPKGSYCGGGEYTYSTSDTQGITGTCPTEYPDSELRSDAKEDCYIEVTVTEGNVPTNCHSATWASCNYRDFYGIEGETKCTPTVTSVTAKAGAYVNGATLTCVVCGTGKYQTTNGSSATSCANSCTTGYTITGTTAADHDSASDCYRVITLDKNGGDGTVNTSVTCHQGVGCDFGSATGLSQTGYTFTGGWGVGTSCTSQTTSFTTISSDTYYACKTANRYTVSFDANGGAGGQTASVTATYNSAMPEISTTAPTLPGYVFAGWFDAKTGGTQYYTAAGKSARSWDIADDKTLYAQWTVGGMNKVTFNENGGTTVSDTECNVMSGDITLPTITRAGHTFDGWYNDATGAKATSVAAGTCVSEMSFTAKWTKCADCTKGTGVSTCSVSVSNNTCVASAECATGYETPKCTGLSCVCTPKSYIVTYNCGDGTGTAPANATAIYNTGFAPATNTCTEPVGYDFSHWNDGTTIHTAGTDFLWTYTSGKTFTAEYVAEGVKTITYVTPDDTKWSGNYTLSCNADTDTFALPTADNIARAGYEFAGWKDATGTTVTSVTKGTCTDSLTFTAQWDACNSTEDGACGCASGTYPRDGVCTSCTTACSTLGAEYQGTYNICATDGDDIAEKQCYYESTMACTAPEHTIDFANYLWAEDCGDTSAYQRCIYDTTAKMSCKWYYGASECVSDSTEANGWTCPIQQGFEGGYAVQCRANYFRQDDQCVSCSTVGDGTYSYSTGGQYGPIAYVPSAPEGYIGCRSSSSGVTYTCPTTCPENAATCKLKSTTVAGMKVYLGEDVESAIAPATDCQMSVVCEGGYTAAYTEECFEKFGFLCSTYRGGNSKYYEYITCNPNTYTVEYHDNYLGGEITMESQSFVFGESQNLRPNLFTRDGYTFVGWNKKEDGTGDSYTNEQLVNKLTTDVDGVVDLFAQWMANPYTIKYNLDGGYYAGNSNPETYTIEDAFVLSNPTKHGYDFKGWFSDNNFNTSVSEIVAGTTGDKEFWAKWEPIPYTIAYNLDGGNYKDGESNPETYTVETNTFVLNKPEKSGFTFNKWTDANGNTVTQIIKGTIGNMVLTANWSSDEYVITYDLDGGANNAENPDTYTISDTPIELKDPVKTGYIFNGWTGDNVIDDKFIAAGTTGNITVTANWTPTEFTVHFDPTDATGVVVDDVTCTYDKDCAAAATIETPNKTFSVWNTQKDGKGKSYVAGGSIKNLLSDGGEITLYAIWDQNMVACESGYYFNEGVRTECELGQYCPGVGEINEGSTGCIETCPAGGATIVDGASSIYMCRKTAIAGDIEFEFGTAKWDCSYTSGAGDSAVYRTDCDAVALTCDAGYYYTGNGAIACTPVMDGYYSPAPAEETGVAYPDSMKAHECPGESGDDDGIGSAQPRAAITDCYSKCALTIADVANSTKVTADADKAFSTSGGSYPACSYTIECNPGYTPQNGISPKCVANKYTIVLDKNQGTGNVANSVECTFDSGACKLPDNTALTRAGYVSAGKWCTANNGSGTCYDAGVATSANISANGTDTKLYAVWEPDVFKIDLVASDATENATQKPVYLKYTVGWFEDVAANKALTKIDTSALPGKSGYNFAGYSVGDVMVVDAAGMLQNTNAALRVTTKDTTANVIWSEGDTVCEAGYYYPGRGGDCVVCAVNHWCPGGTYPTDTGVVGGHEICPDGGMSAGGASATNSGVCYKQGLAYTSTTGKASGTQTCNYDDDTKEYDASCRDHSVKTCVAGYYYASGIDCVEVGTNYYSSANDLKRYECPDSGITGTLKTAGDAGECYKTVDYTASYGTGTQVCNYTAMNTDGSAKYATNCRDEYITSCQGGYYRENASAIDCTKVGYDAYSEDGNLNRVPCPDGGDTSIETAATSTMCFKDENPFASEHGSGVRHCNYTPETGDYTVCGDRIFKNCDTGYYWNAYGDSDCTKVGYGFFGPVADAGNEGYPTARQACATFDGRAGLTETETSGDASACYMTEMPCTVSHGSGIKTCGYSTNTEDYSADCTACMLDTCDEQYYMNSNQCSLCPAGSVCGEQTRTGFDGIANAKPQLCSALFNGRYPESDAGSTSTDQCFGACDTLANVAEMIGRDYHGANMTDTCEIKRCDTSYYLEKDKSACTFCPADNVCNAASGSDMDEDGTPDDTPHTCASLTNGTHNLANAGSTEIVDCYTTCADYEILGGMAIRDFDTVQYDNVCTYKGLSETGNPCEIRTIKGAETCVETSCNPDYELIDGRCKRCDRENATAYKPNGNCLVAKCHTGFHPNGDQCADDVETCVAPNAIAATRTWDAKLGAFGICKITECVDGYHVASNACVLDTEVCDIEHGTGVREWDDVRGTWGECIATSCDAGYTNDTYESDEPNKQCGRCRNAKSVLGQNAVSSYVRGCEIAACLYQGELYNLENNECVPICPMDEYEDETGTMKWNPSTKKCERKCNDGYMSW